MAISSLRTSRAPVLEIGGPSFVLKTCYAIIKTRRYGLETKISLVMDDSGSQYLSFASREEARAWIRRLVEGPTNYLERNESTPLIYAITKVGSRSFSRCVQAHSGLRRTALRRLRWLFLMARLSVPAAAVDAVVVPVPSEILQEGESGIGTKNKRPPRTCQGGPVECSRPFN